MVMKQVVVLAVKVPEEENGDAVEILPTFPMRHFVHMLVLSVE